MKGTRRDAPDDTGVGWVLEEGEYGKLAGIWYCQPPGYDGAGNLARHQVTEHEDGTITVSPSILISDGKTSWHGYLERGVWRVC